MRGFAMAQLFFVVLISLTALVLGTGMKCKHHPGKSEFPEGFKGEIIRGWKYAPQGPRADRIPRMGWASSVYLPRSRWNFQPTDGKPNKYTGLDLFLTGNSGLVQEKFLYMYFQRKATVYLLVHAADKNKEDVTLEGWKFEGWVERTNGERRQMEEFGLYRNKESQLVPGGGCIFSRVGKKVSAPSFAYLRANLRGGAAFSSGGFYSVLVAEKNGSPVPEPERPEGYTIETGGKCPDKLHNLWVTKGADKDDPETRDLDFRTYHPLWDPCYLCTYGHDHGSDVYSISKKAYRPRYGYTALKNGRQNESHNGFKDIVLNLGKYWMYYGIHAHVSQPRRFFTRFHTVVIAIIEKKSKKLLMELRFKADFGPFVSRALNLGLIGVQKEDEDLRQELLKSNPRVRPQRVISVIDELNFGNKWDYRGGGNEMRGRYEQWATVPLCSTTENIHEPNVDFRDPITGQLREGSNEQTFLYSKRGDKKHYSSGLNRRFDATNWVLSVDRCAFDVPSSAAGEPVKVYTDVYGKERIDGPAPNAIAQTVTPGFSITVSGIFEASNPFSGVYKKGTDGRYEDIMGGCDALNN